MGELVLLKLGGSLITDKGSPQAAREGLIRRVAGEVRGALDEVPDLRLVLGHGSGSFGHPTAEKYGVQEGLAGTDDWWGYAETAVIAGCLNRLVTAALLECGVPVVPLQPSASARCHDGDLVHLDIAPLEEALKRGLVPVVYGDVSFDTVRGSAIVSTEQIFAYLAPRLKPSRVILAGHVEGVFTSDPQRERGRRLLHELSVSALLEVEGMLAGSVDTDVTGGMLAKVRIMCELIEAQPTITVRIISGEKDGLIREALVDGGMGEGTLLHR
ncbi:MAG TPA: isopentenyl phosphate kinase [Anaerolineae bacterium]|nr:isopentenyl phosphate kinase [Anaerolineae bacterium]